MIRLDIPKPARVFNRHIYDRLTDYETFTEVHYGGASSGKSHGVIQKVVIKALQAWPMPRKILVLRKVGATVRDSVFADVQACLSTFGLLDRCKVNMSAFRIGLPNGAEFIFKGMDNPEKIKSIKGISDVVMEEALEFTLDDYTQLTLRLRDKAHEKKQIYLMFNPVSKANWVFQAFFVKQPKNTVVYQTTYKDNRFLDDLTRENIEELANRNEAYYKIYALGEFATLDKLVFPKYEKRLLNKADLAHLPSYFGLDYGFINDPSAFLHVKIDDKARKLYVVEEYVRKNLTNDKIAEAIQSLGYAKEEIRADSAEKNPIRNSATWVFVGLLTPSRGLAQLCRGSNISSSMIWWWMNAVSRPSRNWKTTPGKRIRRPTSTSTSRLIATTIAWTLSGMRFRIGFTKPRRKSQTRPSAGSTECLGGRSFGRPRRHLESE